MNKLSFIILLLFSSIASIIAQTGIDSKIVLIDNKAKIAVNMNNNKALQPLSPLINICCFMQHYNRTLI